MFPTIPLYDPNGHISEANQLSMLEQANPDDTYADDLWGTGTALFKLLPGLTVNMDFYL